MCKCSFIYNHFDLLIVLLVYLATAAPHLV
jgi:hypothetical protein